MDVFIKLPPEIKIIIIEKGPLGLEILLEKLVFDSERTKLSRNH